jgi:glycosyltransferase involved in cell wall biosynthesis
MTTIAVICPGPPDRTPSTYYRFGQYKDLWREQGIDLRFLPKQELVSEANARGLLAAKALDLLGEADLIVNQKCLLSSHLFRQIKNLGRPLFFDFDDLIWHRAGKDYSFPTRWKVGRRLARWAKGVDQVICANTYLQSALMKKTGVASVVIPMSLDLEVWCPRKDQDWPMNGREMEGGLQDGGSQADGLDVGMVRVGWTGSPEYHWLLRQLEPALIQAQQQAKCLRFSIHSGVDPQLAFDYDFIPWQKGNEPDYVKSLDIGLLPMDADSMFSLGKSPIKGLQYLACGVVPVGNFCGASLDYLSPSNSILVENRDNEWAAAVVKVALAHQARARMQAAGVASVRTSHDSRQVGNDLNRLFQSFSPGC